MPLATVLGSHLRLRLNHSLSGATSCRSGNLHTPNNLGNLAWEKGHGLKGLWDVFCGMTVSLPMITAGTIIYLKNTGMSVPGSDGATKKDNVSVLRMCNMENNGIPFLT